MTEDHRLGSVARRLAATQRVLVIEDERDIADFLRAYFRASGYDLVHVDPDTPLAVLEAMDEHQPDCVLLDLNLRGFSGAEAYRLLRSDPRYNFVPVIIVTARPDAERLVSPPRGGVDAIVSKPFHVAGLADLVVERIASAQRLATRATVHEPTGLLGHEYVEARLLDEITVAAPDRPASFALVRLTTLDDMLLNVGDAGTEYVVKELVKRARELLPGEAALGLTRTDELAILLPGTTALEAAKLITFAMDSIEGVRLPGGADVPLAFAAGVAAYPEHAGDADGVYMAADAALADAVDQGQQVVVAL